MEKLIPVINRLQDVFNTVGRESIQLPQIAVIGTQSTGKSSVLENVVGNDFLPRGSGIVTRRPLVLQLVHILQDEAKQSWGWGKFLHTGDQRFTDFGQIRDEIQSETDKVAGTNKGISNDPIRLRVFSPHVLNLTLIDLPGITRVPVGDQPEDIEKQLRDMVLEYISNPKCIILAVHAANTDLATSEALKLAREVDPDGNRTLVVCTKLDLMDAGTDAVDLLMGKVIPVKLGIIGVVNRSQQDIHDQKPIENAVKDEEAFFRKRYPSLATRNGTAYLTQTLNKLLMQHIRDTLPILRHDIASKLSIYESQLQALGEPIENKGPALLQTLTRFATSYCQKIEGTSRDIETHQLSGGARICYIFHNTFAETLNAIEPLDGLKRSDILHAISNAMGPRPALFVSEMAFELLVKRQIRLLLQPSLQCIELVYEELQRIIQYCLTHIRDFQRFPFLREKMNTVVMNLLRQRLPVTNEMVENLIAIELSYINTNHPDFVGGTRAAYESYMMAQTSREYLSARHHNPNPNPPPEHGGSSKASSRSESGPTVTSGPTASSGPTSGKAAASQSAEAVSASQQHQQPIRGWLSSVWPGKAHQATSSAGDGASKAAAATPFTGLNNLMGAEAESDRQYVRRSDAPPPPPPKDLVSRQNFDCELIEKLISSYFLIVRKSIQDSVPKAVMHCLVNYIKEKLQSELVSELYRAESYDELMEEAPGMTARRREVSEMCKALQKASTILNEIRDLQFEPGIVGYSDYAEY